MRVGLNRIVVQIPVIPIGVQICLKLLIQMVNNLSGRIKGRGNGPVVVGVVENILCLHIGVPKDIPHIDIIHIITPQVTEHLIAVSIQIVIRYTVISSRPVLTEFGRIHNDYQLCALIFQAVL